MTRSWPGERAPVRRWKTGLRIRLAGTPTTPTAILLRNARSRAGQTIDTQPWARSLWQSGGADGSLGAYQRLVALWHSHSFGLHYCFGHLFIGVGTTWYIAFPITLYMHFQIPKHQQDTCLYTQRYPTDSLFRILPSAYPFRPSLRSSDQQVRTTLVYCPRFAILRWKASLIHHMCPEARDSQSGLARLKRDDVGFDSRTRCLSQQGLIHPLTLVEAT